MKASRFSLNDMFVKIDIPQNGHIPYPVSVTVQSK